MEFIAIIIIGVNLNPMYKYYIQIFIFSIHNKKITNSNYKTTSLYVNQDYRFFRQHQILATD